MSQYLYFYAGFIQGKGRYISMWLNKNRRKGFTMVELIVVLGIIGVMTAIILPMVVGSGKPQEANAKAKNFYYATQNVFIEYKARNPKLDAGFFTIAANGSEASASFNHEYYFVVAEATANEGFKKVTVSVSKYGDTLSAAESYKCMAASYDKRQEFTSGDLLDSLNNYSTSDDHGYYYALVDWQCRVIAAYWADEPVSVLSNDTTGEFKKQTIQFTDNNKVDYTYVGAFPETKGGVGDLMFKN